MPKDIVPKRRDLTNKPLVEAIFELRWALQTSDEGVQHDPGYRFLLGRFWELIRTQYPYAKPLPTSEVPDQFIAHTPTYQFRAQVDSWPLVQLGPGLLTVNDTKAYTWEGFHPQIMSAIKRLYQAYPDTIATLSPIFAQLRYINSLPVDRGTSPTRFLRDRLHVGIAIEQLLFDDPNQSDNPAGLNLHLAFPLSSPKAVGKLVFSTGQIDNAPAIIWEILIASAEDDVPKSIDDFGPWFDAAHHIVDKWFFALSRGVLLETFERPR